MVMQFALSSILLRVRGVRVSLLLFKKRFPFDSRRTDGRISVYDQ